ncbi:MAG: glycosyltransferase [Haliea sp.]|nr:MAG: glycosyltransferase [Haliea sp.]
MRVLFVSDYPHLPDIKGGLQTTTHDLCLAMGLIGAEVAVLCGLNPADGQANPELTPHGTFSDETLGYLCMRAVSPAAALPLAAAAWNASVIVVQSGNSLAPMVLASLNTGRPTAVYLHNVEVHQLGGMLIADPSLLYLANSDFTAERWRALCGLHCHVIKPVVSAGNYVTEGGGSKVLFVNPSPIKGVQMMFALAASCPDLPFLVVESWHIAPAWRAYCQQWAQRLGNVQWLGPQDDMRAVYAQARVLLMPSVWEEAFGRTVIEAQLNGVPVLASNRGALPDTVGEGGLTLDPHAPVEVWAEALRRLMGGEGSFAEAARHHAHAHAASTPLVAAELMGLLAEHSLR